MSRITHEEYIAIYDECHVLDSHMLAQDQAEFWWLIEQVQVLDPKKILEIGTDKGGTLKVWQKLVSPEGLTVSVDLISPRPEATGDAPHVQIIGDSHAPEIVAQIMEYAPFDFVFIDGDHSPAGVRQDHDNYRPMVKPGGLLGFHDTGKFGAVEESFKTFPGTKRTIHHTIGIGVIQL